MKNHSRVNALNSGSVLNTAKQPMSIYWSQWPQSDPSVNNGAKGRKVARPCEERHNFGIYYISGI